MDRVFATLKYSVEYQFGLLNEYVGNVFHVDAFRSWKDVDSGHILLGCLLSLYLARTLMHFVRVVVSGSKSFAYEQKISAENVVDFLLTVGRLKELKRTGWVNHKVNLPESVADHMYRMAIMSFCIDDPNLDETKLVKISVVHDIAESIVGDIVPEEYSGVSPAEKFDLERSALDDICRFLDGSTTGVETTIARCWYDYEFGRNPEGRMCKEMDKLEMVLQAYEYEESRGVNLEQFFTSTKGYFKHPMTIAIDNEIRRRRAELWSGRGYNPETKSQVTKISTSGKLEETAALSKSRKKASAKGSQKSSGSTKTAETVESRKSRATKSQRK